MFWIFMMAMDMLIPLSMILIGNRWIKNPPKEINWGYGYRTSMSMKNKDTWIFAHQHIGRLWYTWGKVLLPFSIVPMLLVRGRSTDEIGNLGGIVCIVQIVVMTLPIFPTEVALRKKYDRYGRRKNGNINEN